MHYWQRWYSSRLFKNKCYQSFQKLSDVSGVRKIQGMIDNNARFMPHLSAKTESLRAVLSKNVEFQLKDHHEEVLKEITDIKYSLL